VSGAPLEPRFTAAVHGRQPVVPDPPEELALADRLRAEQSREQLQRLLSAHALGEGDEDARMRRACWRALARRFGHGVRIGRGSLAKHLETFEIGDGVFVGEQSFIQGRFDGICRIGSHSWLGPQSYFDARALVIEDSVGWGPGARVLGSQHTGLPIDVPIIQTDLRIEPVRICEWADVGTGAVVMPGVTVGRGAIVGAGAVVTHDVAPFAIVAGVPARFVRWRDGYEPEDLT
jgi:acetyltransferase-like isoleucine patch superfamily enzyme